MDFRQIKVDDDDFGLMTLRPRLHEHGGGAARRSPSSTATRGILEYRGLSDRAARGAVDLPRGRLPARPRRAARPRSSSTSGRTRSRSTRSCTRTSRTFINGFRHDAHPMGMLLGSRRRAVDLLPGREQDPGPRQPHDLQTIRLIAKMPTLAAFAYRHSQGMPYVYPDNDLRYAGQLPEHDVQDDRAEVRAGPSARAGARRPVHPARRPRAELLHQRGARRRLDPGRPVLGGRRRRRRALRPAARRRQRGRAADARGASSRRTTSPTS